MILNELKIELTNRCLLNCIHCSTMGYANYKTFLPNLVIDNLIDQAHNLSCTKICFSGGEPLLHSGLDYFLKKLYLKGIEAIVYTTGIINLNPPSPISFNKLKAFKMSGLSNLIFSLYASNSFIHDSITQVNGSFETTIKAIKNSLEADINTEVHFVALKDTIDEIHSLSEFVQSLGIRKISILRFVPQGRGKLNSRDLTPTSLDFLKLGSAIVNLRKNLSRLTLRLGSPFNFLLLDSPKPCTAGLDRMLIDPYGFAYPCDALKQVKLTKQHNNGLKMSLLDIFRSDPLFQLARKKVIPDSCRSCSDLERCLGGCFAQRFLTNTNSYLEADPSCLRMLGKTDSRIAGEDVLSSSTNKF